MQRVQGPNTSEGRCVPCADSLELTFLGACLLHSAGKGVSIMSWHCYRLNQVLANPRPHTTPSVAQIRPRMDRTGGAEATMP
eukprot:scaffold62527_cov16-Tisochrysis_lutea.AAC.2